MRKLSPLLKGAATAAFFATWAACAMGQTAFSTDPVGVVAYAPTPVSDSIYALPMHRSPVYEGVVASISAGIIGIQDAGWMENNFVYGSGATPANTYYLLVITGAAEGMAYKITANTADTLTIESTPEDLSNAIATGNRVQIVPYWTLGTLFPNGEGVTPSASAIARKTQILTYDRVQVGTDLSPSNTFYYSAGNTPGWRKVGGGSSANFDDQILLPGSLFIYRQPTDAQNTFAAVGAVQMARAAVLLETLQANTAQDNYIAFTTAAPMSLKSSRLVASGAFKPSTSHLARADQLYVFDNSVAQLNKSPVSTYYYFSGTNPGWRKVGSGTATLFDDVLVFQPGNGYLIRKAATASPQSIVDQTEVPSYLTSNE